MRDLSFHPCSNVGCGLAKPPLKSRHELVTTQPQKQCEESRMYAIYVEYSWVGARRGFMTKDSVTHYQIFFFYPVQATSPALVQVMLPKILFIHWQVDPSEQTCSIYTICFTTGGDLYCIANLWYRIGYIAVMYRSPYYFTRNQTDAASLNHNRVPYRSREIV